ncbi:hypothetical protein PBRA_006377 [Plasmodiophora brassicae]|uniref:Damage-inducible protein DinB n=1 Tax=Plasmodiophora brassicae TaxID=37360 RepID=A0A0G4ISE6_PLABS|nr:hypothetical protein PBRA_006377 [Plasmodiophora brassicae]
MSLLDAIRRYARYNVWATDRLLAALQALPDDKYHGHASLCFRSIHGTLNHLVLADQLWLSRFKGVDQDERILSYWDRPDTVLYAKPDDERIYWEDNIPSRDGVADAIRISTSAILEFVEGLPDDVNLGGPFTYKRRGAMVTKPHMGAVLMHVVNHGTHHRGQITAACTQFGLPPPSLDFIYYLQ